MHTVAELGTNVPAFLGKLWKMVEDPTTNDLIAWSSADSTFVIKDEIRFARELLPMYYKHNNMASFIRQLNMYGFHKIVSPDAGSMKLETPDEIMFTHPFFKRGHPYLLENIKRKIGVSRAISGQLGGKTPQIINKVLTDVRQLKGRQENLDSQLAAMKMENGALWQELSKMRKKHLQQQHLVNQLIEFLMLLVKQNGSFTVKRKFPRMLQHHDKGAKHPNDVDIQDSSNNATNSPMGPVIHELEPAEALLDTVVKEAATESGYDVTDYYLNQSDKDGEDPPDMDLPQEFEVYTVHNENDCDETIIGLPEDTLIINTNQKEKLASSNSTNNTKCQNTRPLLLSERLKKEAQVLKPKFFKEVNRKSKKNSVNKERSQQRNEFVEQVDNTLLEQIQINKQQLERNEQQRLINKVQLERNQNQIINEEQQIKKSQNQLQRNGFQQLQKSGKQLLKKSKQQSQKSQKKLQASEQQEEILMQRPQSQPQTPSQSVITIPLDSGSSGDIITEVVPTEIEQLYGENATENFDLPVVVDVTSMAPSPSQTTSSLVAPQDLLIGSPMVINDPVMTPQCEPVVTPLTASPDPNPEMQVACMDESLVTPSPIVTRSAHLLSEMDNHLETMQSDLDSLKELLRSEGISLDANTLLACFNEDPLCYNMCDPNCSDLNRPKEVIEGNELMTYNPSLYDLSDLMETEWSFPTSPSEQFNVEDSFAEVNTPQFVPQSPTFPSSTKKRKK